MCPERLSGAVGRTRTLAVIVWSTPTGSIGGPTGDPLGLNTTH
jgi:hypothetical protein